MTTATESPARNTAAEPESDHLTAWQRVALGGIAGVVLFTMALQVIVAAFIPPVTVFGVIFAAFFGLCFLRGAGRRWPWVVAGVGSALFIVGNIPHIIEDLAHPETPFTFVPVVVGLVAALLVVASAVAITLRSTLSPVAILAVAGALSIAAVGVSGVAVAGLDRHEAQAGDLRLIAERALFPEQLAAQSGGVSLFLDNQDRMRHTFVIDELGVHVEMPGLAGRRAEFAAPAGEYRFYCDVPGHDSMVGTLIVGDAAAGR